MEEKVKCPCESGIKHPVKVDGKHAALCKGCITMLALKGKLIEIL